MLRLDIRGRAWFKLVLILIAISLAVWLALLGLPPAIDWEAVYVPAVKLVLAGESPYLLHRFYNPIWALIPILPLALLPIDLGRAVYFLFSAMAFAYAAHRLGGKPVAVGAFLASPPVVHCLLAGNLDWIPMLGFSLAPRWGLFLVIVKPQMGAIVALFWLVEAWRTGGWRQVVYVFWPITAALVLSVLVFGAWFSRFGETVYDTWNASLWPASLPVGLALTVGALRVRRKELAMAAGPCLSPYLMFHSWGVALASILSLQWETLAAVIGLWLMMAIRLLPTFAPIIDRLFPGLATLFG